MRPCATIKTGKFNRKETIFMFTRDKNFYKTFFRLCLALMLEQAVILSVNLADNMMLGT